MTGGDRAFSLQFMRDAGNLNQLDCTDVDTASAHYTLGQAASGQIWRTLYRRLDELGDKPQVCRQLHQARIAQKALQDRMQISMLVPAIREALEQYISCLSAWANGAGLAQFVHPMLPEKVEDLRVSAEDLATFLQEDEVGCQTGTYRERDGAVVLWHTEEDFEKTPGERFDQLRLFSFRALGGRAACGFIYPDLLPGPSFAWQADFTQAIDTLHVRSAGCEYAILPNTMAWLSLYLGAQISRTELAKQLGPFRGGYSLTAVHNTNKRVEVEKVEFANDALHTSQLEHTPGSYLFQTNAIRDLSLSIGAQEQTSPESRAWNEKRMARTERFVRVIRMSSEALPSIFRMLHSRLGGESAYANQDVKANLVCYITPEENRIWVGCGMPVSGDNPFLDKANKPERPDKELSVD